MSQGWQEILYKVEDRVATITLNRPDKLNAWTAVMAGELREALAKAEADEGVRAIVLTGAGRGFCAGADMSRLAAAAAGKSTLGRAADADRGHGGQLRPAHELHARRQEADHRRHQRPGRRHRPRRSRSIATSATWRPAPSSPPRSRAAG